MLPVVSAGRAGRTAGHFILFLFLFYSKVEPFKISWNIFRSWSCLAIQKISNRGLFVNKIKNISIKGFQSVVYRYLEFEIINSADLI